jgi:ankyrin repeat protein
MRQPMLILNKKRCYNQIMSIERMAEKQFVLSNFAGIMAIYTNASADAIEIGLTRHLGLNSTYTYKALLTESIQSVDMYLNDKTMLVDTKQVIVDRLLEGLDQCTPGFHARVNSIALGLLRPQSIDGFLEQLRVAIVDATARRVSDDVHVYNAFFIMAAKKYGVRALHQQDSYANDLSISHSQVLDNAFEIRYNPIAIICELFVVIEGELRIHYGYQGRCFAGYTIGIYGPIITFFENLLNNEVDPRQLFLYDDNYKIEDINWLFVQKALRQKLDYDNYITFGSLEVGFFNAIYNDDAEILFHMLTNEEYQVLAIELNIIRYPQLLKYNTKEIRECLAKFFNRSTETFSITTMYQYLIALHEFCSDNKEHYATIAFANWSSNENNLLMLKETLITHSDVINEQTIQAFNLLSYILNNQLQTIAPKALVIITQMLMVKNSEKYNALMLAIQYQLKAIKPLLTTIATLTISQQIEILTAKNQAGNNALMLAVVYQPTVIPTLLALIAKLSQQSELLITQNNEGYNALMIAVQYQPIAIEPLLSAIVTLPISQQIKILTAKNRVGNNALMLAAQYQYTAVPILLALIAKLSQQSELLITQSNKGNNVLMIAAQYQPMAIEPLLTTIKTLSSSQQIKILMTKNKDNNNALSLAAFHNPNFDFKKEINKLIMTMITKLDDTKTYENRIKENLQAMKFDDQNKQLLVLDVLIDLKTTYKTETEMAIAKAINNNTSPLYQALNALRYRFYASNNQTASSMKETKQLNGLSPKV